MELSDADYEVLTERIWCAGWNAALRVMRDGHAREGQRELALSKLRTQIRPRVAKAVLPIDPEALVGSEQGELRARAMEGRT